MNYSTSAVEAQQRSQHFPSINWAFLPAPIDDNSRNFDYLFVSGSFPLQHFGPPANLMSLQMLLRVSISFMNHKANNVVRNEMSVTIDRTHCIIFCSRSYFFEVPWSARNSTSSSDSVPFHAGESTSSWLTSSSEFADSKCILSKLLFENSPHWVS
jgi:hypothetical protein